MMVRHLLLPLVPDISIEFRLQRQILHEVGRTLGDTTTYESRRETSGSCFSTNHGLFETPRHVLLLFGLTTSSHLQKLMNDIFTDLINEGLLGDIHGIYPRIHLHNRTLSGDR